MKKTISIFLFVLFYFIAADASAQQRVGRTVGADEILNTLLSQTIANNKKESVLLALNRADSANHFQVLEYFKEVMKGVCKGVPQESSKVISLEGSLRASFQEMTHIRYKLNQLKKETAPYLKKIQLDEATLMALFNNSEQEAFKLHYGNFKATQDSQFEVPTTFSGAHQLIDELYNDYKIKNEYSETFRKSFRDIATLEELDEWGVPLAHLSAINKLERFFVANEILSETYRCHLLNQQRIAQSPSQQQRPRNAEE